MSSKLTEAIETLTKLSLMRERVEKSGSTRLHTNVISTLFDHVAGEACLWVRASKHKVAIARSTSN